MTIIRIKMQIIAPIFRIKEILVFQVGHAILQGRAVGRILPRWWSFKKTKNKQRTVHTFPFSIPSLANDKRAWKCFSGSPLSSNSLKEIKSKCTYYQFHCWVMGGNENLITWTAHIASCWMNTNSAEKPCCQS